MWSGRVQAYVPELVDGLAMYGRVTDDTHMTLFTVEGIIRGAVRTDRGLGSLSAWSTTRMTAG
jgi:ADP-ribosylglycohydrolase